MKKTLFLIIICNILFAQVAATTEKGKKVLLMDDGTWVFKKEITSGDSNDLWLIRYFVDSFGDKTKSGYITTKKYFLGLFSNSATEKSELKIKFIISRNNMVGYNDVAIQLYEYGGKNPVKSRKAGYSILWKHNGKIQPKLHGANYSDRISLDKLSSEELMEAFLIGGVIKFKIIRDDNQTQEYAFEIDDLSGFNNVYKIYNSNYD